ncbi:MAG: hypothetical protein M3Y83_13030 [Actinomycetota bacterium]|nr:hypothetical protein [Actinomycetota bacterium]
MAVLAIASLSNAPFAAADPSDKLRAAVSAMRGTSCGALQSNPIVEQAADQFGQADDEWIERRTRAVPVEIAVAAGAPPDAIPLLTDLGYETGKAAVVYGAAATEADSIQALLLQGYAKIPDCSYTVFGASTLHNSSKDLILTTVVLAA